MKLDLLSSASLIALGAALTLSVPGMAGATTITGSLSCGSDSCTETLTLPPTKENIGTPFLPAFGDFPASSAASTVILSFNQFDATANETLKSVNIQAGGGFTSTGSLNNLSSSPQTFEFGLRTTLGVYFNPAAAATLGVATPGDTSSYSIPGPGSTPFDESQSYSGNTTLTTGLAAFTGAGSITALLTANASQVITASTGFSAVLTTTASPTVTITYDYTTVSTPEPASMALLGVGLSGLGVIRRRRKG